MTFDQRMAIDAAASERLAFIRRTYLHVAGALVALAVSLAALVNFVPDEVMIRIWTSGGPFMILLGFMGLTFLANRLAQSDTSSGAQYLGLGLTVAAYAFMLWPLVWRLTVNPQYDGVLGQAVVLTLALAGGLTTSVLVTRKDFTFLGPIAWTGSWVAFGLILAGMFFGGFHLGLWFSLGMIALMSVFILYETSLVLHRFHTNQHVAAAVAIFSSIATLFFYVARALMSSRD